MCRWNSLGRPPRKREPKAAASEITRIIIRPKHLHIFAVSFVRYFSTLVFSFGFIVVREFTRTPPHVRSVQTRIPYHHISACCDCRLPIAANFWLESRSNSLHTHRLSSCPRCAFGHILYSQRPNTRHVQMTSDTSLHAIDLQFRVQ